MAIAPAGADMVATPNAGSISTVALNHSSPQRTKLIMLALCTSVFVVSLDTFIMTNALPTIAIEFGTTDAGFAWIGSAYMLAFGVVVPVWANISNVFGRKPILIITNVLFFVGTLIGALSGNAVVLIAGRAVQGVGGGGLTVLVNICVGDLFSIRDRGLYFGVVGAVIAIAAAAGSLVGGILTQAASWRDCFWINVPFTGLSFILLIFLLNVHTPKTPVTQGLKAIDWLGSILIISATLMLLLGLQLGGTRFPWNSIPVICLIAFGLITFGIFIVAEWKVAKSPLIPLRFFAQRSRIALLAVCVSQSFITTARTYFLPLYFQLVLGVSPLISGVYFLPTTLTLAIFFLCVGHIVKRTGEYVGLIQGGVCALQLGTGLLINSQPYTSWPRIIIPQILVAVGLGLTYQAPLIAFHAQIDPQDVATGTSTFQFIKTFSQTISVIFGQVIFQNQIKKQSGVLSSAGVPSELVAVLSEGNAISSIAAISTLANAQRAVVSSALVAALNDMWIFYTVIASFGLVASLGIARIKLS
ncbi:MAG: hypothetical protein Q9187_002899 [Circinaria calcarea]